MEGLISKFKKKIEECREIEKKEMIKFLTMEKNDLRLYLDEQNRFRLYYKDNELTKGAGLQIGILSEGVWYDSSDSRVEIERPTSEEMVICFTHNRLPLIQSWHLSFKPENTLNWEVGIEIKESLRIDCRNASVFLSKAYKDWFVPLKGGEFPSSFNSQWQSMNCRQEQLEFIGMSSSLEDIPSIVLKNSADTEGFLMVQNTDLNHSSRVLEVHIEEEKDTYEAGSQIQMGAVIQLYPDKTILEETLKEIRQEDKKRQEEEERKKREEENKRKEEEERKKREEENKRKEEEERKKREEENRRQEEERKRQAAEKKKQEEERKKQETEERKKKETEQRLRTLEKGPFKLYVDLHNRFHIYYNGIELTHSSGLDTKIVSEGNWYSSTDSKIEIKRPTPEEMVICFTHNRLPLIQSWHLSFKSDNKLNWEVGIEINEPLRLDYRSASIFLSKVYKDWLAPPRAGKFPSTFNSGWQSMNCREEHPEFIGVSSSLKELPSIVFKDQEGSQSLLQIHNTDLNLSSRVLEIQFIEDQGAYQPGTYPYLKAAIEFYPDKLVLKYAIEELERQRKINLGKPKYCFIVPSKSCMFKCKTCNMWKLKRDSDEMTIEEWKKCLGELADFAGSPMVLQFLGGEPLMKEGIIDLVAFADKKGYNTVLTTNGYLIDEDMAKKIGDSGLVTINLSLHSLKEQTHDFITGIKGSFRRLMNAIELLHKYRINTSIGIDTLILDVNLDELVEMVEWVNSDKRLWRIFFLACVQPFVQEPDSLWYTREENESLWPKDLLTVHRVLDELISLKEKGYKIDNPIVQLNLFKGYFEDPYGFIKSTAARKGNCPRGDAALEISPTGEVSLCFYMEFFGNVRNNSIKDLWYLPKVSGIQKAINNCRMECDLVVNCPYDVEDSVLERK